jgi:EmrB/QacA subfamily drug resistance transporter
MSGRTLTAGADVIGGAPVAERTNEAERRVRNPAIALAVIVACQLMVVLDGTIVNIALPNIQRNLGFSETDLSWVLNAYALAFGGLLLLGGRAGDILGRRRMFVAGIVLFTAASLLGGFATSAEWLLISRAVQGIGAAMAAPNALALVLSTFAEGPERTRALSIFSSVSAFGASVGLIAGGMLTAWVSWRWVMFVNVPIGIAIALLAPMYIVESERHRGRLDIQGAVTGTLGTVSLVYGFIRASTFGWTDSLTLAAFAAAIVLLGLFLIVELRASEPIMPLRLFADRNRASGYLNMLLLPAAMFGMFFFLTQFVQDVLGFSPIVAGLAFLPLTIVIFAASQTVPRLLPQFGPKPLMVAGGVLITLGMIWLTQISATTSYIPGLLGPMLLFGAGLGFSFTPLTVVILSGLEPGESGSASGLLQTMQQVGGSLGIAILVTQFGIASRDAATHPLANASAEVQANYVTASAMSDTFVVAAIIAVATLVVSQFAIRARGAGAPDQPGTQPPAAHL